MSDLKSEHLWPAIEKSYDKRGLDAIAVPIFVAVAMMDDIKALQAELAALRAEPRYVPVSDGERIEIDSAGDSMGIARPSAVHVRGNSRISIEMTSLSMAGASRYLHSGKMPTGHAVCRLVPGQDTQQQPRVDDDVMANAYDLLEVVKLAYRKHHGDEDAVGWSELGDKLADVLSNAMSVEIFVKWQESNYVD